MLSFLTAPWARFIYRFPPQVKCSCRGYVIQLTFPRLPLRCRLSALSSPTALPRWACCLSRRMQIRTADWGTACPEELSSQPRGYGWLWTACHPASGEVGVVYHRSLAVEGKSLPVQWTADRQLIMFCHSWTEYEQESAEYSEPPFSMKATVRHLWGLKLLYDKLLYLWGQVSYNVLICGMYP